MDIDTIDDIMKSSILENDKMSIEYIEKLISIDHKNDREIVRNILEKVNILSSRANEFSEVYKLL